MGRPRTGQFVERNGKFYARVNMPDGARPRELLPWCKTQDAAERRAALIGEIVKTMLQHGRVDIVRKTAKEVATAPTDKAAEAFRVAVEKLCTGSAVQRLDLHKSSLFSELAESWTSGALSDQWPDAVKRKDWSDDISRLNKYINPIVGHVPLPLFELAHAEEVMRRLPTALQKATRRQVQQIMVRVLNLAVYPAKLIVATPIPKGFLIYLGKGKAKPFLYPDEERALLGCPAVPLSYRMLYGIMAREGCRLGVFLGNKKKNRAPCTWRIFDLKSGFLVNDWNKSDDPSTWFMNEHVTTAIRRWKERFYPDASRNSLVFLEADGSPMNPNHMADKFRRHLQLAGVDRPELFEAHEKRVKVRAHDLRATFVTISLAGGKTERWVMQRTQHTTSDMVTRYERAVHSAQEANMTSLHPMVECIPELAEPAMLTTIAEPPPQNEPSPDGKRGSASAIEALTEAMTAAVLRGDKAAAEASATALRILLDSK
jgi:integrase